MLLPEVEHTSQKRVPRQTTHKSWLPPEWRLMNPTFSSSSHAAAYFFKELASYRRWRRSSCRRILHLKKKNTLQIRNLLLIFVGTLRIALKTKKVSHEGSRCGSWPSEGRGHQTDEHTRIYTTFICQKRTILLYLLILNVESSRIQMGSWLILSSSWGGTCVSSFFILPFSYIFFFQFNFNLKPIQ